MTAHHAKRSPHVKYIRLHSSIKLHTKITAYDIIKNPSKIPCINPFTTMSPYKHTYNNHSLKKKCNFIHHKPSTKLSHLLLSCPNISLSGKVACNPLSESQNIVGETLLLGTPAPPVSKHWAAT